MRPNRIISSRLLLLVVLALLAHRAGLQAATPTVTAASPNQGTVSGGTKVTISGTGFTTATAVRFGGTLATSFEIQSDIRILATTPSRPEGTVNVTVTNPDGTGTLTNGFTYKRVPFSGSDDFSTELNTPLQVFAPGVLSNDNTNEGGDMTVAVDTNVANGTLTLNADGSFIYTPTTGFSGIDSFTYRATNGIGTGDIAGVIITVRLPTTAQQPTGLYVSAMSGNMVTFRWRAPLVGLTPTHYIIEGGNTPGDVAGTINTGSTSPIFTFAAPNGALYYRVRAVAGTSQSAPSNEIQVFVNVAAAPSAPADLVGLVNGTDLALAWRNTLGGGPPTGLVLDVTGSVITSIPLGLTQTFSFTGVPAGTYTLALRATNATGSSTASVPVTLTFPGACSGIPLPPSNVLVYKSGSTIFIVWDAASSGAAPTSFVLNVSGAFVGAIPTTGRSLSGTVGAGTYTFSVTAVNACGSSTPSTSQSATIP